VIQLRDYQRESIDALYAYFQQESGNPLLVLPTGSGKSVINAIFIKEVLSQWRSQRIVCLTHVKELIVQNYDALIRAWPEAPAGIFSASVGRRDLFDPVIFAGIQSVHKRAETLGWFDLVIIDEAHMIPNAVSKGMYRRFLDALKQINPAIKIIGLTATPYRLKSGLLTEGDDRLFTDIAHEIPISLLIKRGYLSPLVTPDSDLNARADLQKVGSRGGEFIAGQLANAMDKQELIRATVDEMLEHGKDRKSWLIFCSSVEHATNVASEIIARGVSCDTVTGDTPKTERNQILSDFKSGEIQALTNVDVLTTGFDAPNVDLLAFLRPTKSVSLYIQMCGRGMRTADGKESCLVLDFAGNIDRHGPVDKANAPTTFKSNGGGGAMTKVCPKCQAVVHLSAKKCGDCLHPFPEGAPAHGDQASNAAILSSQAKKQLKTFDVTYVSYSMHPPKDPRKPLSMRADYYRSFMKVATEWICFEHSGFARKKAEAWWRRRHPSTTVPETVNDALNNTFEIENPTSIVVDVGGKYPQIVDYKFEEQEQKTA